jgi:hypothetical protein
MESTQPSEQRLALPLQEGVERARMNQELIPNE